MQILSNFHKLMYSVSTVKNKNTWNSFYVFFTWKHQYEHGVEM